MYFDTIDQYEMILGTTSNLNFIFGIFEVSDNCQLSMTSKSYFHMLPSAGNSIYNSGWVSPNFLPETKIVKKKSKQKNVKLKRDKHFVAKM